MVIVTQQDYLAKKEYYKDQMRAAQKHRLVREALAGREQDVRLYAKALAWLGRNLVAWGSILRQRYGTMVAHPIPRSADRAMGR
jgi:hypothetical protein